MNNQATYNSKNAEQITDRLAAILGADLSSVLLFGSAAQGSGQDLDLVIVLTDSTDFAVALPSVRAVIAEFGWPIDAHVVRASETRQRPFCLNTQGVYLLPILQKAVVLHGRNPFLTSTYSPDDLAADTFRKIQHYVFRARQAAVGCNRTEKPDDNRWLKFVRKCSFDILAATGSLPDFAEAPRTVSERWPDVISPDEAAAIDQTQPISLEQALPLLERIYAAAPRILNLPAT